jgi:hypothetical protein
LYAIGVRVLFFWFCHRVTVESSIFVASIITKPMSFKFFVITLYFKLFKLSKLLHSKEFFLLFLFSFQKKLFIFAYLCKNIYYALKKLYVIGMWLLFFFETVETGFLLNLYSFYSCFLLSFCLFMLLVPFKMLFNFTYWRKNINYAFKICVRLVEGCWNSFNMKLSRQVFFLWLSRFLMTFCNNTSTLTYSDFWNFFHSFYLFFPFVFNFQKKKTFFLM